MMLTTKESHTLKLICDTFVPTLGDDDPLQNLSATELGVHTMLAEKLPELIEPDRLVALRRFFQLIELAPVNGLSVGVWKPFSRMASDERARVLLAWGNSPLPKAREAFQAVKRFSLFLTYASMPDDQPNPAWASINYEGAPGIRSDEPKPIQPLTITTDTTLTTDVLVIGSGAGGGVVAGELSAAEHQVLVIEKAGYYNEADFDGREIESNQRFFERSAALTSEDTSMSIFAGSALGGGTTINWMGSFRTPDYVLQQWAEEFGFTAATSADFQNSLDAVSACINVNTDESHANGQNSALERGCHALGEPIHTIPRNVKGCDECGFCNMGCAYGAKQSTLKTYLQAAYERGTQFVVNAHVDRITHQNGTVTGALATVTDADGKRHPMTIRAKTVVVAGGALHTPAILKRSGLQNPQIGKNLFLHPVSVIFGKYDQDIVPWQGAPMTRYYKEHINLDRGYGYWIEVPPLQPGLMAMALPWLSAQQHRAMMQHVRNYAMFIILTRDRYGGEVTLNKDGSPRIRYRLHTYDAQHLKKGLLQAIRIQHAAGAKTIYSPHNNVLMHERNSKTSLDDYLKAVEARPLKPNTFSLVSAHQMSTCRIASDPQKGALKPSGESYEISGLYVADASALPTCAGINPMLTIMGVAHHIAQHIKAQL